MRDYLQENQFWHSAPLKQQTLQTMNLQDNEYSTACLLLEPSRKFIPAILRLSLALEPNFTTRSSWSDAMCSIAKLIQSPSAMTPFPTIVVKHSSFWVMQAETLGASTLSTPITTSLSSEVQPELGNLPTELILEIYNHFDHIAQIVALNSTSRMFYEIWRLDPGRVSSAVLLRSIDCYGATVEIQEAEGYQHRLNSYQRCDPLKSIGRERIGRERIVHAFYLIWHLTVGNSCNPKQHKVDLPAAAAAGGDDRDGCFRAMDAETRDNIARVSRFLLFECSGEKLTQLGISLPVIGRPEPLPRCLVPHHWITELARVASSSHDEETPNWILERGCLVHKGC